MKRPYRSIPNYFKALFIHNWCDCFQNAGGNIVLCCEDGFKKAIHSLELMFIITRFLWHPSLNKSPETCRTVQENDVTRLEEVPCQVGAWTAVLSCWKTQTLMHRWVRGVPTTTFPRSQQPFDNPAQPQNPMHRWRKKQPMSPSLTVPCKNISSGIFGVRSHKDRPGYSFSYVWC